MRKYFYVLLISVFASFTGIAQNVPNGGFENWNNFTGYSTPVSWNTTDSIASTQSGQRSVLQEATVVHGGASAMKMQSWIYSGFLTEPGAASNGSIDIGSLSIVGGTPDSVRHDMLTGWYESAPATGDTCFVSVLLTKWNGASRDTIGIGRWSDYHTVSSYTQFSMHLSYPHAGNPDTVLIVIGTSSIGLGSGHAGTILYMDDLNFSGINSTNDLPANSYAVSAFPNPASDFLTIELKRNTPVKGAISILDISGKLLQIISIVHNKQLVDVSSFSSGNYFYELADEKGTKLYSGKFSVSH